MVASSGGAQTRSSAEAGATLGAPAAGPEAEPTLPQTCAAFASRRRSEVRVRESRISLSFFDRFQLKDDSPRFSPRCTPAESNRIQRWEWNASDLPADYLTSSRVSVRDGDPGNQSVC